MDEDWPCLPKQDDAKTQDEADVRSTRSNQAAAVTVCKTNTYEA